MYQAGLVLEGGGMKGVYTAGVLDFFLENGIEFSSVYGVSAGACHMSSYLSKQKGRALAVSVDYLDSKHYCSKESLLLTGDLFNVKTCYHLIPDYLYPYDYDTFKEYPGKAYSVVTNVATGKAEYMRIRDLRQDIDKVQASASLPLVSKSVKIDGNAYLDGGISDSIPIQKSILDGNRKNVVIMTKEEGYVKTPPSKVELALMKVRYFQYPELCAKMAVRYEEYNRCVKMIERKQAEGELFLIRPKKASGVSRIEKDKEKLIALYEVGYQDAKEHYEDLKAYLEN